MADMDVRLRLAGLGGALAAALAAAPAPADAPAGDVRRLEAIVVTAERLEEAVGSVSVLGEDTLDLLAPAHPHELATRVPGAWVSRGSGQEHLTAIRSPVLTGAGACGAFLFLEDGIPIRPAGFCNVNQLFELNTEQARRIEILRGPGNALWGSNAMHGSINVVPGGVAAEPGVEARLTAGSDDFYRVGLTGGAEAGDSRYGWAAHVTDAGSFRDDEGYREWKVNLHWAPEVARGDLRISASATSLDQDTAGFILGEDAYRDETLRTENLNPEAFRKAEAQRLYAIWQWRTGGGTEIDLRPYVRRSDMDFLQHFLPGKPLEENGHVSAGMLSALTRELGTGGTLTYGLDLEWADGFLEETQDESITFGSPFLQETRPAGKHYDYEVESWMAAPHVTLSQPLGDRWQLEAGLRVEYLRYDYDNRMLTGNTREDGTPCGFGGCLFNRPADRTDSFTNAAPKLLLAYRISPDWRVHASVARGFRVPQATELYRLQRNQSVADLDSETIDQIELGLRGALDRVDLSLSAFAAEKENVIFRDSEGFNVSDGATTHVGLEYGVSAALGGGLTLSVDGTWARHRYDFTRLDDGAVLIRDGDDVDTAPRSMTSARLAWRPREGSVVELEWIDHGAYYIDEGNDFRYPGHELWHLRASTALGGGWFASAQVNNLTDELYADRADFAFGNYRYFPAPARTYRIEIGTRFR